MSKHGQKILINLLTLQNQIKLYHWQTRDFPRHDAADKFFEKLLKKLDKFIEAFQGRYDTRIKLKKRASIPLLNLNDKQIIGFVKISRKFLESFDKLIPGETDLLNIRDEILGSLNQMLYRFTLK
jgi:hypothetical protein